MNGHVETRLLGNGLPESLGILPRSLRFPHFILPPSRAESFQERWPDCWIADSLATCGFFCVEEEHIQCYSCGGEVIINRERIDESWTEAAIWQEHAYLFPKCCFLHVKKGSPFIKATRFAYLPVDRDADDTTPDEVLIGPLPVEKAFHFLPCDKPGMDYTVDRVFHTVCLVDQNQSCLVKTVKDDLLKNRYDERIGFENFELVKCGSDGSWQVMEDKHLIVRYTICGDCTIQLAPSGSTMNRPGRALSPNTLHRNFGIRRTETRPLS